MTKIPFCGNHINEVKQMSYFNPTLRSRFESLPIELKNEILSRNVHIETLRDLIAVLEDIVREGEADSP